MTEQHKMSAPFQLFSADNTSFGSRLRQPLLGVAEKLTGLSRCRQLYRQIDPACSEADFPRLAMQQLEPIAMSVNMPGSGSRYPVLAS